MTRLPQNLGAPTAPSFENALIVEGGAMRGIFSTGVLDRFLEARFNPFDLLLGVSSGAANLAAYLARMPKRNFKIYTDYSLRPEFISLKRFVCGGHLMDLDWLWDKTIAEIRLDLQTIFATDKRFLIGLTDVATGEAIYMQTDGDRLEAVLKASSAMPIVYRTFPLIDGRPTVDGGISDPLPVDAAIRRGARQIMVIRSRPKHYKKREMLSNAILRWKLKPYPALRNAIAGRVRRYNEALSLIRTPPPSVSILEICPPDNFRSARFGRNKGILMDGYEQGRSMGELAMRSWAHGMD
jgi:predicted patatin/cPLA2 family phospholipase